MTTPSRFIPVILAVSASLASTAACAYDTSYLEGLLANTAAGSWVNASVNTFSSAWAPADVAAPTSPSGPGAIVNAWSSFAWDSTRGNLMLFGGGHANYVGNEVYAWQGSTGTWTMDSLASKVTSLDGTNNFVVGAGAPQASHTYATNTYVAGNDRFVVYGGAAYNSGGSITDANGRTGSWWFDPTKASSTLVGGQNGTGWNTATQGAYAWTTHSDPWTGANPSDSNYTNLPNLNNGTTAYRQEMVNGVKKDVVYVTMDQNSSGFSRLWRDELGTTTGSTTTPDSWSFVGMGDNSIAGGGSATIDSKRGLFVRTALTDGNYTSDLAVWNLSNNNAANPDANENQAIELVNPDGTSFTMKAGSGLSYDSKRDMYVIWDGQEGGTVWETRPELNADGSLSSTWTVKKLIGSGAQPKGFVDPDTGDVLSGGVLGKWKYVAELGAFVALDSFVALDCGDGVTRVDCSDSKVWLYKPVDVLTAVPEASTYVMMLGGLGVLAWFTRQRRRNQTNQASAH